MDDLYPDKEPDEEFLEYYARKANEEHFEAMEAAKSILPHAQAAGAYLLRAKKTIKGKKLSWQPWVQVNFKASYETAAAYMRVARNWDEIEPRLENQPDLSLREVLSYLRVSKEKEEFNYFDAKQAYGRIIENLKMHLRLFSDDELVYLANIDDRLFDSKLEEITEEIEPIAPTFVKIEKGREFALKNYYSKCSSNSKEQSESEAMELKYSQQYYDAFIEVRGLSRYQRDMIFEHIRRSKKIKRRYFNPFVVTEHESPEDWLDPEDRIKYLRDKNQ